MKMLGYLAFFDSDGSTYLNLKSSQMYITAGQKTKTKNKKINIC